MKTTIQQSIENGLKKFGGKDYIFERNTEGKFIAHTYKQFVNDVKNVAAELERFGDGKIAIFAKNSYNYMVVDTAIMGFLPSTCVAISKDWQTYDLKNAIEFLGLCAIIYSAEQQEIIDELKPEFSGVEFIPIESVGQTEAEFEPQEIPSDVCTKIVFTSGTTSAPKAVMLSQDNMFTLYENLMARTPLDENDSNYLFLPLHHVYAGICVFLYSLVSGMSIYLCSDTNKIVPELMEVQPTSFCAVSLIYERVYEYCTQNNIPPQAIFGKNIKYLYCGAANFKPEVKQWLKDNNMPIIHSYGMTETSSLIALEYPFNDNPIETVGTICEDLEVKIDNPDEEGIGEILVRGGNIFSGYYNTDNTKYFDEQDFFRTGDLGYTKDNLLFVTGRKKRMILFNNGENIYPEDIEQMIMQKIDDIKSVKIYMRDESLCADVATDKEIKESELIEQINQNLPKNVWISSCIIRKDTLKSIKK